ncbi:hypothetical protein GQ600_2300 [Phytophthora cactorum]|nr:hypothetical protein GQ600_2300 [Phytophthora cactorum]
MRNFKVSSSNTEQYLLHQPHKRCMRRGGGATGGMFSLNTPVYDVRAGQRHVNQAQKYCVVIGRSVDRISSATFVETTIYTAKSIYFVQRAPKTGRMRRNAVRMGVRCAPAPSWKEPAGDNVLQRRINASRKVYLCQKVPQQDPKGRRTQPLDDLWRGGANILPGLKVIRLCLSFRNWFQGGSDAEGGTTMLAIVVTAPSLCQAVQEVRLVLVKLANSDVIKNECECCE